MLVQDSVIKIDSGKPGKKLAIFCGVHGNEKAGVYAVDKLLKDVSVTAGAVYFVYANLRAIEQNIRYIEKNLNRCFLKGQNGDTYEEKRARELIPILDEVDVLLDLHSSNNPVTIPFVAADSAFDFISNLNFEIIVKNFNEFEPGATDGYMFFSLGKQGICLECGYAGDSESYSDLAYDSALRFLKYYGAIDSDVEYFNISQRVLRLCHVTKVPSKTFSLVRTFDDFETIEAGTLIATDGEKEFRAEKKCVILFGIKKDREIGEEAYLLGEWE